MITDHVNKLWLLLTSGDHVLALWLLTGVVAYKSFKLQTMSDNSSMGFTLAVLT